MEKIKFFIKTTKRLLIISIIISLGIGFFLGMEYKSYQIRSTLQKAINPVELEKKSEIQSEFPKQKTETSEIKAVLIKKGFIAMDIMNDIYNDLITFEVEFTNNSDKNIRGFKGSFEIYNIFGEKIQNTNISYDDRIKAKETKIWNGSIKYNPFIDSHTLLKNTELENLKYEWKTEQVIYEE